MLRYEKVYSQNSNIRMHKKCRSLIFGNLNIGPSQVFFRPFVPTFCHLRCEVIPPVADLFKKSTAIPEI